MGDWEGFFPGETIHGGNSRVGTKFIMLIIPLNFSFLSLNYEKTAFGLREMCRLAALISHKVEVGTSNLVPGPSILINPGTVSCCQLHQSYFMAGQAVVM